MQALIVFSLLLAVCHAGVLHAGVFQGPGGATTLVGPDGSHIKSAVAGGSVAVGGAPAVIGGVVPAVAGAVVAPGIIGGIVGGHGLGLVGSGIEGQYIPSGLERLYDDGSYRAEHHLAGHNLIFH